MRPILQSVHAVILRLQGGYAALFTILFFIALPGALAEGQHVGVPLVGQLAGFAAAITLLTGKPGWLVRPGRPIHFLPAGVLLAIAPFLFAFMSMSALILLGLPEPLGRNLSVLAGLVSFLLCGVAWWLALVLSLWTPGPSSGPDLQAA
ncbi:hypothetical protein [Pseudoponticoccus marisrubri]|nr:hypothetical protein [Pseudoponticoccus marisrubri]